MDSSLRFGPLCVRLRMQTLSNLIAPLPSCAICHTERCTSAKPQLSRIESSYQSHLSAYRVCPALLTGLIRSN